ncbi:hypothetical protein EW146_g7537 [Bondarzewia mesenterica]|uniref:Uncharacterized protein n=1 Tax=Bondarzewia mesenterica TaxID=1095465 RepID=A0A4S4LME0_9AGAM|nr:hypothetical protein EW146_g7537 [Bondarzewia mesenterica]
MLRGECQHTRAIANVAIDAIAADAMANAAAGATTDATPSAATSAATGVATNPATDAAADAATDAATGVATNAAAGAATDAAADLALGALSLTPRHSAKSLTMHRLFHALTNTGDILKEWAEYINEVFDTTEVREEAKEKVKKRKKLILELMATEDGRVMLPSPEKDKTFDLEQMKGLVRAVMTTAYRAASRHAKGLVLWEELKEQQAIEASLRNDHQADEPLWDLIGNIDCDQERKAEEGQSSCINIGVGIGIGVELMGDDSDSDSENEAEVSQAVSDRWKTVVEELLADPSAINLTILPASTYTQCNMGKMSFLLNFSAQIEYRMMLSAILQHEDGHLPYLPESVHTSMEDEEVLMIWLTENPYLGKDGELQLKENLWLIVLTIRMLLNDSHQAQFHEDPSANADVNANATSNIPPYVLTTQLDFLACNLLAVEVSNQITEALLKLLQQAEEAELVTVELEEAEEMNSKLQKMPDISVAEEARVTTELAPSALANDKDQDMTLSKAEKQASGEVSLSTLKDMVLEQEARDAEEEAEEHDSLRDDTLEVAVP